MANYNNKYDRPSMGGVDITKVLIIIVLSVVLLVSGIVGGFFLGRGKADGSGGNPPSGQGPGGNGGGGNGGNGGGGNGGGNGGGGNGGGGESLTGDTSPQGAVDRFQSYISEEQYNQLFLHRYGVGGAQGDMDFFTYKSLLEAIYHSARFMVRLEYNPGRAYATRYTRIDKVSGEEYQINTPAEFDPNGTVIKSETDLGAFLMADDANDRERELAGFFANISHETTGGWATAPDGRFSWGLCWREEDGYADGGNLGYVDASSADYPPTPGKSYHGRGPIQLSWNFNYGLVSGIVYGDKKVLLDDPSRVINGDFDLFTEQGSLAFETGILFWMMPQPPKASCSDVMSNRYVLTDADKAKGFELGFGLSIIIINGGLESGQGEFGGGQVEDRVGYYRRYAGILGANIEGEKVDTLGMQSWV
ncbi:MAG: chitinase [Firmicutes bacterium]|nr:chitinase [Bacillota bacterium]